MHFTGTSRAEPEHGAQEGGPLRAIDGLGRVVIPAEIRREFDLAAGDFVAISVSGGSSIILRPANDRCPACGRPNRRVAACDSAARRVAHDD
jgi:AbrB family looped-hinge helix DNA binding protein